MKTASLIIAAFIMLAITLNWFRYVPSQNGFILFDRLTHCIIYEDHGVWSRNCPDEHQ